jgi:hypothetical protein
MMTGRSEKSGRSVDLMIVSREELGRRAISCIARAEKAVGRLDMVTRRREKKTG